MHLVRQHRLVALAIEPLSQGWPALGLACRGLGGGAEAAGAWRRVGAGCRAGPWMLWGAAARVLGGYSFQQLSPMPCAGTWLVVDGEEFPYTTLFAEVHPGLCNVITAPPVSRS